MPLEILKKVIVENTGSYANGRAVNVPTEMVESLEIKFIWMKKCLFHRKFSMHFSLVAIT
jgi:hypothetical protein